MNLNNLIANCIQNDREAQRKLYENYKDSLYTIVFRITGDRETSNDLLQETFIDAFKNLSKLKERDYFYSWIRKILVRKAYASLKARHRTEELEAINDLQTKQSHKLDVEYIETAIQKLPYKSRTVFVMAEIEGFSHKEISESLNISVGTSKSQLHYAKSNLKKTLRPYLKE